MTDRFLRHFVASVRIDGGIPSTTVSKRLGHSQMSTTLAGIRDPVSLAVWLLGTPCSPLYKSNSFPDKELAALVGTTLPD